MEGPVFIPVFDTQLLTSLNSKPHELRSWDPFSEQRLLVQYVCGVGGAEAPGASAQLPITPAAFCAIAPERGLFDEPVVGGFVP